MSWSPLLKASHAGDRSRVEALLLDAPEAVCTDKGDTALHLAAIGGHQDTLEHLLDATQIPIDAANAEGWTPLMLSLVATGIAPERQLGCITLLLSRRASISPATSSGWSAVLIAAHRGFHRALAKLLERGPVSAALEARTTEGDSALHLACLAGSDLSVRLMLAAGADPLALNERGMDAAALAIDGACEGSGINDLSDAATQRFEDCISRLVAAHAALSPANDWAASHHHLLHRLASAPHSVPLRRLMVLAALLRRCGCDDTPIKHARSTPEAALPQQELASSLAERASRPVLASLLRAPPPPAVCLLCMRCPHERAAPTRLAVEEGGAVPRPRLRGEPSAVRRATCLAMRSAEEALNSSSITTTATDAATRDSSEADAADGAAAAIGGGRVRWRMYRCVGELAAPGDALNEGALLPLRGTFAQRAPFRESLEAAIASCVQAAPPAPPAPPATRVAAPPGTAAARRLPAYGQRQRWHESFGASIDVIELQAQPNAPLLHDAHLELLRGVLGSGALDEADEDAKGAKGELAGELQGGPTHASRPWTVYTEDLSSIAQPLGSAAGGSLTLGAGDAAGGWQAVVELFSIDTPQLLVFAMEAGRPAGLAGGSSDDEAEDGDDDGEVDDQEDALMRAFGTSSSEMAIS